jgi:hypothetical protein
MIQRKEKKCGECDKKFQPTGSNCKRCPPCRRKHFLRNCKERWYRTYVKKGYNQSGPDNNSWKGGSSPAYYQRVASELPDVCARCNAPPVLVHHKDGNRRNASIDNLERLCKRCHQIEHQCPDNLPQKVVFKSRICDTCSRSYQPTGPRGSTCLSCRSSHTKV